jgi:hypothetical protein
MSISIALRLIIVAGGFLLLTELFSLLPPPSIPLALDYLILYSTILVLPFTAFFLVLRRVPVLKGVSKTRRRLLLGVASFVLMLLADFAALEWMLRFGGKSKFPY